MRLPEDARAATSDRDAAGDGRVPAAVAAVGRRLLAGDSVSGLAEEVDGGSVREAPARRRLAAETQVLGDQRVGAVTEAACRAQSTGGDKPSSEKHQNVS